MFLIVEKVLPVLKLESLQENLGADISKISGTQRSGRVSEDDVKNFIRSQVTVSHGEVQKKKLQNMLKSILTKNLVKLQLKIFQE